MNNNDRDYSLPVAPTGSINILPSAPSHAIDKQGIINNAITKRKKYFDEYVRLLYDVVVTYNKTPCEKSQRTIEQIKLVSELIKEISRLDGIINSNKQGGKRTNKRRQKGTKRQQKTKKR
jgi:hypothetical protein